MRGLRARLSHVLPLLAMLVVACGGGTDPSGEPPGTPPPGAPGPDNSTPLVSGALRTYDDSLIVGIGTNVYLPSDSIHFDILAQDDSLAWIGFVISGAITYQDSVAVPVAYQTGVRQPVTLIRTGLTGTLTIRAFARDHRGHRDEVDLEGNPAHLVASQAVLYPQVGGGAEEFAIDLLGSGGTRRSYWVTSTSVEREDGSGFIGPTLPAAPQSVDILTNPDSLIVTLPSLGVYAIVDLGITNGAYPDPVLIPDTVTAVAGAPWALRTAANGHVIVQRRHPSDAALDSWVDLDPETGTQILLRDVVVTRGRLTRTVDHTRIAVWDTTCCAGQAQVYTAATGAWSAAAKIGVTGRTAVTMDNAGNRLLAGTQLYALPSVTPVARFRPAHLTGSTVLSPDGLSLIAVTSAGFLRVWRDNQAADLTAMTQYYPEPLIPLPDIPELLIPVLGPYGYFRAGVRLPATTHTVAASLAARPTAAGSVRLPPSGPVPYLPTRTVAPAVADPATPLGHSGAGPAPGS